jgi:hypothetical protein
LKTLIIFASVLILTTVTIPQTDSITITKKYAGILSIGTVDIRSDYQTTYNIQFMGGLESRYVFNNHHSLMFRARFTNDEKYYGAFWYNYSPNNFTFSVGYISRQISEIRPTPISAGAHFEPFPYFIIPGGALGIYVNYNNEFLHLGTGVSYDDINKIPEANFGFIINKGNYSVHLAALISQKRKIGTVKTKTDNATLMFCASSDSLYSFHISYSTDIVDPFFVVLYNWQQKKFVRYQFGITKTLIAPYDTEVLVGCGYEPINKEAKIYFWMYLL